LCILISFLYLFVLAFLHFLLMPRASPFPFLLAFLTQDSAALRDTCPDLRLGCSSSRAPSSHLVHPSCSLLNARTPAGRIIRSPSAPVFAPCPSELRTVACRGSVFLVILKAYIFFRAILFPAVPPFPLLFSPSCFPPSWYLLKVLCFDPEVGSIPLLFFFSSPSIVIRTAVSSSY